MATSGLLKGVAIGGVCVPLVLGYLMQTFGPGVLIKGLAAISVCLIVTYFVVHMNLKIESAAIVIVRNNRRRGRAASDTKSDDSRSAHHAARDRLRSLSMTDYELSDV